VAVGRVHSSGGGAGTQQWRWGGYTAVAVGRVHSSGGGAGTQQWCARGVNGDQDGVPGEVRVHGSSAGGGIGGGGAEVDGAGVGVAGPAAWRQPQGSKRDDASACG
jgi:hypothetical protein